MSPVTPGQRAGPRPALLVGAAALLAFCLSTGTTYSGWTAAALTNTTNNAVIAKLDFTHDYPGSPNTCQAAGPTASTTCSGALTSTAPSSTTAATKNDTITNNSTLPATTAMYEQGRVVSCAPVQFADARSGSIPLLPRYTVGLQRTDPYGGTNAVQFDGAQSYASAAVAENAIPATLLSLGGEISYGAWFKTSTTVGGPIFAYDSDPASAGGSRDKVLYMNTAGRVGFAFDTNGATTGLSTSSFNNGLWHFAYARITIVSALGVPITSAATLYIDGTQVATSSSLLGPSLSGGYFHLGWSPISGTSYGSGLSNYFNGHVSNAVIFQGSAPAVPAFTSAAPGTQAVFDSFAAPATHQWRLGDDGTTTFTPALGFVTGGDPCSMVRLAWTMGAGTVFAATTLSALVSASWQPATALAGPVAGASQTATTSYSRVASGYDLDVMGLHLYAPLAYRVGMSNPPASGWSLTFTWQGDPAAAFIA